MGVGDKNMNFFAQIVIYVDGVLFESNTIVLFCVCLVLVQPRWSELAVLSDHGQASHRQSLFHSHHQMISISTSESCYN